MDGTRGIIHLSILLLDKYQVFLPQQAIWQHENPT